jgi:cell wall-associated NlpC family hydrolase
MVADQPRHRVPQAPGHAARLPMPRSPLARQSTITMLAVSAVGAGAAMTGQFPAIQASDDATYHDAASHDAAVQPAAAYDDVLVSDPGTPATAHTASMTAANTLAEPAAKRATASAPSGATTAAVLSEDTHQANARDIAALARSVDMERSVAPSAPSSVLPASGPAGGSSALSAVGLGGGGPLGAAPGAMMRATAMNAALSKVGVPYVWGAAGPRAFDCSGLVLWAFKRVGISLPHSSAAQSRMGAPVAKSDLRPGDLVFFYSPVSHVAMYIGNGMVVHASEPGQPVKVTPLSRAGTFHNARRLAT